MWIRIGFNADQDRDLAFCLHADPDLGSQANADFSGSRSWSDFKSHKKLNFNMKSIFKLGNIKNQTCISTKTLVKGRKPGVFCKFWSISMLLDPDPDPQHCRKSNIFFVVENVTPH